MTVTDTDLTSTMTPTSCNEVDTAVVDDDIKSPFENLPSEIRNETYSLVAVKDEPIYLRLFEPNHGESVLCRRDGATRANTAARSGSLSAHVARSTHRWHSMPYFV